VTLGNNNGTDGQTDGQTDRQTDRVRRNMRPPPREEGRIIKLANQGSSGKMAVKTERERERDATSLSEVVIIIN